MKKKFTIYWMLVTLTIALCSCNEQLLKGTKEAYLQHFEQFLANIKQGHQKFHEEDWNNADKLFNSLSDTQFGMFEIELTENEKNRIDQLIGQYTSMKIKYRVKTVKQDASHLLNRLQTTTQELIKP